MSLPQQLRQQTSNCRSLLIYRPQKDERLSWPSWLTYSGWLTHIGGHPSAASRAQDSERTPAKDRCSTAGPRNQLGVSSPLKTQDFVGLGKRVSCAETGKLINTLYDMLLYKEMPFWGRDVDCSQFGGKNSPKTSI